MKKNIFYIINIAILMIPTLVMGQDTTSYTGKVKIAAKELVQRGDSLYLNMNVRLDGASVDIRKSIEIIPVISDGMQSRDLPKISIQGKRKYKEYRRQMALMSKREREAYVPPFIIEKGYGQAGKVIDYNCVLPFETWMKDAWLEMRTDLCGCGLVNRVSVERVTDNITLEKGKVINAYDFVPALAYVPVKAEGDGVKQRVMQDESYLDFAVNRTDIRSDFGNNPRELAKIREMIEGIRDDKGVTIRDIHITGYASPEGSLALNKRLSEGRAKALQSYLEGRYDIPARAYVVDFGGEDWDGLVKLLERSDMPGKQQVLDVIRKYSIENGREKRIMTLAGGQPYRYMLKMMFPSLRRVVCQVNYEVKPFNVEEAKEVIKTSPQNLSLNEMYAVANTYEDGSEAFCDVFEIAVKMFPGDEIANLNAAIVALSRKDTILAARYLERVKTNVRRPEYDNAMGVLLALQGDYKQAAIYFELAAATGLSDAKANLEQIRDNGLIETAK